MNQHKLTHRDLETNTRRSTIRFLLLVCFTLVLAVPALAQALNPAPAETTSGSATSQPASSGSKFAIFGDVGVAVPHGDLNVFFDPGVSVNAGVEYMITSQFSAVGTLGYNRFSSFFGGHASLYQVSGNGKFYLVDESSKVRPFVNGGLGAYVTDSGTAHFGGNVGGGVLYEATPHFGVQGSYNFHIFSAGSTLKYSTVQAGVRFRF